MFGTVDTQPFNVCPFGCKHQWRIFCVSLDRQFIGTLTYNSARPFFSHCFQLSLLLDAAMTETLIADKKTKFYKSKKAIIASVIFSSAFLPLTISVLMCKYIWRDGEPETLYGGNVTYLEVPDGRCMFVEQALAMLLASPSTTTNMENILKNFNKWKMDKKKIEKLKK